MIFLLTENIWKNCKILSHWLLRHGLSETVHIRISHAQVFFREFGYTRTCCQVRDYDNTIFTSRTSTGKANLLLFPILTFSKVLYDGRVSSLDEIRVGEDSAWIVLQFWPMLRKTFYKSQLMSPIAMLKESSDSITQTSACPVETVSLISHLN